MNKAKKQSIGQSLKRRAKFSRSRMAIVILAFALIGAFILIRSLAAPNPNLQGDLNNDNTVNVLDLSILLSDFNTTNPAADINNDGHVNVLDLSILLSHWGQTSTGSACTISATLVNSCRPWLGGFAANYTQTSSGFKAQINYQEQRIGRQLDLVHNYHPSGSNSLSADDISLAGRANTILYINWKPNSGTTWADTGSGTNSTANAGIDSMANSIKSAAPAKIMVALWGEPERSVSSSPTCGASWPGYKSTAAGFSTTDYVNMWHNVRNRFNALGVTNVVWVMNLTGFSNWACMVKDLWPGNSDIDWVMWDPYAGNSDTFASSMGYFYNWMTSNSDSTHDFNSKAWGLAEYGSSATSQSTVYSYYDEIKSALDANTYPKLKAYTEFDNVGTWDTRTLYDYKGDTTTTGQLANDIIDNTEQSHYNALAQDPRFTDGFYTSSNSSIYWGAYMDGNDTYSFYYGDPAPDGQTWQDAPWGNTGNTWDRFEQNAGKKVSIIHYGQPNPWNQTTFYGSTADIATNRGALDMIDMSSQTTALTDIANGVYDPQIKTWAANVKAWGKPFFLRWDWEMNGTWFNWGAQAKTSPTAYVNSWKHFHDVVTSAGATNVTWVWCPNVEPASGTSLSSLYPGSTYVDWTCMDGYNMSTNSSWQTFTQIFGQTYKDILAIAPGKPMMIGETSSREVGGSKAAWITDALTTQLPNNFPQIKAFVWFNWRIAQNGTNEPWPIESSSTSQAAFKSAIASSYYTAGSPSLVALPLLTKIPTP